MGSIVKSIGKAIKKVGKFVKKAAPYILMAAALYAGVGAFGASLPGATGSMFAWSNVKAGASAIGRNIAGMVGGSAAGVGEAAAQAGAAGLAPLEAELATKAVVNTASGGMATTIKNLVSSAIQGNKGYALLAGGQLLGTGITAIAAAFDDTEEKKLEFAEKQLRQQGTRFGFAMDEGRTPDEMPADSPFWMGYNQNLAMNAGAPIPGQFAHGIRTPTTSNRRTLNYDYSPRGVVTQSAAKTFNQKPQGMLNFNTKGGILNA